MKCNELIREFINGATKGKASNLYIEGNKLINYSTVIAIRKNDTILLNSTRYSVTTSKNTNIIRRYSPTYIELSAKEIYANL